MFLALNSHNPLYFKGEGSTNSLNMGTGVERKGNEKKSETATHNQVQNLPCTSITFCQNGDKAHFVFDLVLVLLCWLKPEVENTLYSEEAVNAVLVSWRTIQSVEKNVCASLNCALHAAVEIVLLFVLPLHSVSSPVL